jgi:LAGLIDADG endonuclease
MNIENISEKLTPEQVKELAAPGELHPMWIVGFVDGDGCFSIVTPSVGNKRYCFVVSQHKRSEYVLYQLKYFFGCGNVHNTSDDMMEFRVEVHSDLIKYIFPFFEKYPLQSYKINDLQKLSDSLYFQLNLPNPFKFVNEHSYLYKNEEWLAGLVDSDGCFTFALGSEKQRKAQPQLVIVLAPREKNMLTELKDKLEMGIIYVRKTGYIVFQISKQSDHEVIISILSKRLKTTKRFSLWYFVAALRCWQDYVARAPRFKRLYKTKNVVVEKIMKIKKRINKFPIKKRKLDTAGIKVEDKVQNEQDV